MRSREGLRARYYSDERELVGDLLRFGADVEVLEPANLSAKVK